MISVRRIIQGFAPASCGDAGTLASYVRSLATSSWLWLGITGMLTLVLYGPIFDDWFQKDDFFFLRAARFTNPIEYVREAIAFTGHERHEFLVDLMRDQDIALPFLAYRPLYFLSLEGMYLAFGENPMGYHVVSVAVHLANAYLVWRIATRLVPGRLGPHIAALIFALHPTYVETVAWISDIGTPLAIFTVLLSLLFFTKSLERDPPHIGWYVSSYYLFGASVFFHQETISWVAVFAAYFLLVTPRARSRMLKPETWAFLVPFLLLAGGSYALQVWLLSDTPINAGTFHIGTHMLTHFKNLSSLALFPDVHGSSTVHFIAFVSLLGAMAGLVVLAYLRKRTLKPPHAELFVIVWFLAALAPLLTPDGLLWSNLSSISRKLYVAGPPLAILLVMVGMAIADAMPRRMLPAVGSLAALLLIPVLILSIDRGADTREQFAVTALRSERFIASLQETYPTLPQGSTLYVLNAPIELQVFQFHLVSIVQSFYGKVDARAISASEADARENAILSDFIVFRYMPPSPTAGEE